MSFNYDQILKKKHYNLFIVLQKKYKARKWSQELFAFSFAVPYFQSHLSLITIFTKIHIFILLQLTDPKFFIVLPVNVKIELVWPNYFFCFLGLDFLSKKRKGLVV